MKIKKSLIKCKYCDDVYLKGTLNYASHLESYHSDLFPPELESGLRMVYYNMTNKTHGNCVMCKKPTDWNEKAMRYERFCNNPACKKEYREIFKKRMIGKYQKVTLLNDPDMQRFMLSHRKISGSYVWRTQSTHDKNKLFSFNYTGSYELDMFEFMDRVLEWDPSDIIAPSPHNYYYKYNGKNHFYIPDIFIPSLNCEIEIKDGGDNPNTHPKIQNVDKEKERLKDDVMRSSSNIDYIKITNKNYAIFLEYLDMKKEEVIKPEISSHIVMIGK